MQLNHQCHQSGCKWCLCLAADPDFLCRLTPLFEVKLAPLENRQSSVRWIVLCKFCQGKHYGSSLCFTGAGQLTRRDNATLIVPSIKVLWYIFKLVRFKCWCYTVIWAQVNFKHESKTNWAFVCYWMLNEIW